MSHYIHGSEPVEQDRLSRLNDLLNAASHRALRLAGNERVLDVGCGLGQLTCLMAASVAGQGRVVAIERDTAQLAEARRRAEAAGGAAPPEFRAGSAESLPLADDEWGTFDVAHCRFLLEHVPDPLAVVRSMVRAVRDGGRIILEDDDHDILRLAPDAPRVDRLWRAYFHTYARLGNDPYVGRRLVSLLVRAGADPVRNDLLFFGTCAGSSTFGAMVDNFVGVLSGARGAMLDHGMITADEYDEALAEFGDWRLRPDAALWYGTCWAEGICRRDPS